MVARLRHLSELAERDGQISAAIAAEREIGVLTGHRIERQDVTQRNTEQLDDAEQTAMLREAQGKHPN